jgi:class 3 adenylate cyclase
MRIAYLLALQLTSALRNARHFEEIRHLYSQLEVEKKTADQLLLNILPEAIAHELKEKGQVSPVYYPSATVMFSDFAGFTQLAAQMPPNELLQELDFCFSGFDQIIARHGLEKLKTIGDSYMCVGGVPVPSETHAVEMVTAALEMMAMMKEREADKAQQNQPYWQTRMGIHTGPLIAGVIGRQKFSYDIWGNTVNLASRVEAASLPNAITISKSTYELVKDVFCCESRGEISIKGADKMEMYLVIGFR